MPKPDQLYEKDRREWLIEVMEQARHRGFLEGLALGASLGIITTCCGLLLAYALR